MAYTEITIKIVPQPNSKQFPMSKSTVLDDAKSPSKNIRPLTPEYSRLAREADVAVGAANTGLCGEGPHSTDAMGRSAAVGCSGSIVHLLLSELPHRPEKAVRTGFQRSDQSAPTERRSSWPQSGCLSRIGSGMPPGQRVKLTGVIVMWMIPWFAVLGITIDREWRL